MRLRLTGWRPYRAEGVDGHEHRACQRVDAAGGIALVQVVQDGGLVQVAQPGQVVDAVQQAGIRRHYTAGQYLDRLCTENGWAHILRSLGGPALGPFMQHGSKTFYRRLG